MKRAKVTPEKMPKAKTHKIPKINRPKKRRPHLSHRDSHPPSGIEFENKNKNKNSIVSPPQVKARLE